MTFLLKLNLTCFEFNFTSFHVSIIIIKHIHSFNTSTNSFSIHITFNILSRTQYFNNIYVRVWKPKMHKNKRNLFI